MPNMEPIKGDGYILQDNDGKEAFIVDTNNRIISLNNKKKKQTVFIQGDSSDEGFLRVIGSVNLDAKQPNLVMRGKKGIIELATSDVTTIPPPNVRIDASDASIVIGNKGIPGLLRVRNAKSEETVLIQGDSNQEGYLRVIGSVNLDAKQPNLVMRGKKGIIELATSDVTTIPPPNVRIDASDASVVAGGNGKSGQVKITDDNSKDRVVINAADASVVAGGNGKSGKVKVTDDSSKDRVVIDAANASVAAGGNGKHGSLVLNNDKGKERIIFTAAHGLLGGAATIAAGGNGASGLALIQDDQAQPTVIIVGQTGSIIAGGNGKAGKVTVNNNSGQPAFTLDGEAGDIKAGKVTITDNNGDPVVIVDGGYGITLKDQSNKESILLDAANNAIVLCNKRGIDGQMVWLHAATENGGSGINLRNQEGHDTIKVDADNCAIVLSNKDGNEMVWLHADPDNGSSGITLRNQGKYDTIQIDGERGDVILVNADCAEDFDVVATDLVEPGTVMALNDDGKVQQATQPYDRKVAGVVSGAGGFKPGLVLGRSSDKMDRLPIALTGKVYCKVDADYGSIRVGDLLTTSNTPGHAMKAQDSTKAFGAVLGKALAPLAEGCKLIPILVSLQ